MVTGASGFVAGAVIGTLARKGLPVTAVSRRPVTLGDSAATILVTDYRDLEPPSENSVLIHLAEPSDIGQAEALGDSYVAARTAAIGDLITKTWLYVVYASSAAVYGDIATLPRRVDETLRPRGVYAEAKAACEQSVLAAGGAVARLSNVYGPGMSRNNVISDILKQIPGEGPLIVRDRKPVRDYIYIDDAAAGLVQLAVLRRPGIFNIGSGQGSSVESVVRMALRAAHEPDRSVVGHADNNTPSNLVLDIGATMEKLCWSPKVGLQQGLARIIGTHRA